MLRAFFQGQSLYDLLVIGGGINGAGIARDAQGRGLKCLLVEARDLASATSSASSKLIHGGLRYLEQYEFRLVREALSEREVLLRAAGYVYRGSPASMCGCRECLSCSETRAMTECAAALEAMAIGVPVLASTRGALPEVTGDAALLLPPDDAGAWADALRRVLSDKDLRATLSQRGLVRAQAFSWDESARTLGAVYLAAAERRKARQR